LRNKLILKIGYSHEIVINIPKVIFVKIKNDERKKPNILWFFSYNIEKIKTMVIMIQNYRRVSAFLRKRVTGLLALNELSSFKFKNENIKRKKENNFKCHLH